MGGRAWVGNGKAGLDSLVASSIAPRSQRRWTPSVPLKG